MALPVFRPVSFRCDGWGAPLDTTARDMGYYYTMIFGSYFIDQQRCGARTRKGTPCKCMPIPGRRRCKFHGGLSTGPKTAAGKARISEAQKRRWAARPTKHSFFAIN